MHELRISPKTWLDRRPVLLILAVVSLSLATGLLSKEPSLDFSDVPILLPPYWSLSIRSGVSGTVVFRVHFSKGRVRRVDTLKTDLEWREGIDEKSAAFLSESLVNSLREPIMKWESFVVSEHETDLTVVLLHNADLGPRMRNYQLEYGEDGIVRKIVMTAPVFNPPGSQ